MPKASHDDRARNRILDSAAMLFSRHGYDKTSIRFLANEARVSTSTIYAHFADKSDLLLQAVDRRLTMIEETVAAEVASGDDPLCGITQSMAVIHANILRDPFLRKILTFDPHVVDHRLYDRADLARGRIKQLALTCLRAAINQRALVCSDVEALEAVLRLSFQGWLLSLEHGGEEVPEERFTAMLVRLVEGLRR